MQRVAAVPEMVPDVSMAESVPCNAILLVTVLAVAATGICPVVIPDIPEPPPPDPVAGVHTSFTPSL